MVRRKLSLKGIGLGAAFAVTAVGILTFYVWYQTESVKLGIESAKSRMAVRALEESIAALKLRRTELLAPARVEQIAREELGLVEPANDDIIFGRAGAPPLRRRP
jgi:cell division protein FtsL